MSQSERGDLDMRDAHISEIFGSIQGEGLYAGSPAVFVIFGGCNLSCSYCDTQYARTRSDDAYVYAGGERDDLKNPVPNDRIASVLRERFDTYAAVVLTGGEPLVQASSAGDLAGRLRMAGFAVHLETNGSLPEALREMREVIDFVCMDYKLPSTQEGRGLESEHRDFLEALRGIEAAVKIVVTEQVPSEEVERAAGLIAGVNRHLPVLLQPAFSGSRPDVSMPKLLELRSVLSRNLSDVRISVQLHKILGIK
jgi:organic radical activating enzyme